MWKVFDMVSNLLFYDHNFSFSWGCFSFMCRVLHINDIIPTCVFLFRPQMTFFLSLDVVSIYLRELWEVMQECWRSCNAYMKTRKKKSMAFTSLLKFLKRTPAKKISIELKSIKSKPRQVKFKSSTPSSVPSPDVPMKKILPPKKRPIPPPAPPLSRRDSELSPFMARASLTSPDLDKKSPEFRLAHMRFYNELKILFPMLNKKAYYEAKKSHLGVKLRSFQ